MKVIIFGATGMVGQSVLRECLLDSAVQQVTTLGRTSTGIHHQKLQEIVHPELFDLSVREKSLTGLDACFFCLGVSAVGMSEEHYRKITYDLTLSVGEQLSVWNPHMTFVYVTGMGTDSTGKGRSMWARVKGKTENDLLKLPFKAAYMFRPAGILPLHGERSKSRFYQMIYVLLRPFYSIFKKLLPNYVTTSVQIGRAMIKVARQGYTKSIIENKEINQI